MTAFDDLLRRALMDANLAQYRAVWEAADAPVPSPQYLRECRKLMADPFAWAKKRTRPVWKKALQAAACLLLASAVTLGSLMALSPAVRAAVFGWLREISNGNINYIGPEDLEPRIYDQAPTWRPGWLPEGWRLDGVNTAAEDPDLLPGGWYVSWYYQNGTDSLDFSCIHSTTAKVGMALGRDLDGSYAEYPAMVWGKEADFYKDGERACLVWMGCGGELFQLKGSLDQKTLERIADSVTEVEAEPMPDYRLGWLPENSGAPYARSVLTETVREQWDTAAGAICEWMFAAESVCPLAEPEQEGEAVTVNGAAGRFWAAEAPEDPGGGIQITTGSTGETRTLTGEAQTSTLIWTDETAGVTFRIQGDLKREDILHIAERVYLVKTENIQHP